MPEQKLAVPKGIVCIPGRQEGETPRLAVNWLRLHLHQSNIWLQACFSQVLINRAGCSDPRNPRSQRLLHKGSIFAEHQPLAHCAGEGAGPLRGHRRNKGCAVSIGLCHLGILSVTLHGHFLEKIKCMGKGEVWVQTSAFPIWTCCGSQTLPVHR